MAVQRIRPILRDLMAVSWDGSAAAEADVRRLVGLAGCRVEFGEERGVRLATVRGPKGKRRHPAPCWMVLDGRDAGVIGQMHATTIGRHFKILGPLDGEAQDAVSHETKVPLASAGGVEPPRRRFRRLTGN